MEMDAGRLRRLAREVMQAPDEESAQEALRILRDEIKRLPPLPRLRALLTIYLPLRLRRRHEQAARGGHIIRSEDMELVSDDCVKAILLILAKMRGRAGTDLIAGETRLLGFDPERLEQALERLRRRGIVIIIGREVWLTPKGVSLFDQFIEKEIKGLQEAIHELRRLRDDLHRHLNTP